jgi:hypothetical protein
MTILPNGTPGIKVGAHAQRRRIATVERSNTIQVQDELTAHRMKHEDGRVDPRPDARHPPTQHRDPREGQALPRDTRARWRSRR